MEEPGDRSTALIDSFKSKNQWVTIFQDDCAAVPSQKQKFEKLKISPEILDFSSSPKTVQYFMDKCFENLERASTMDEVIDVCNIAISEKSYSEWHFSILQKRKWFNSPIIYVQIKCSEHTFIVFQVRISEDNYC